MNTKNIDSWTRYFDVIREFGFNTGFSVGDQNKVSYQIDIPTPKGRKFSFEFQANDIDECIQALCDYAMSFSVKEYVKENLDKEKSLDVMELIEDAQWIKDVLIRFSIRLCSIPEKEPFKDILLNITEKNIDGCGSDASAIIRIKGQSKNITPLIQNALQQKKTMYIKSDTCFDTDDIITEILQENNIPFEYESVMFIEF